MSAPDRRHINARGQCRGIEIAPGRWSGCRGEADCPSCHGALEGDCATDKRPETAEEFKARVVAMLEAQRDRLARMAVADADDRDYTRAAHTEQRAFAYTDALLRIRSMKTK